MCALIATAVSSQTTPSKPSFENADIHLNSGVGRPALGSNRKIPYAGNGRYEVRNVTLLDLISLAYGVDAAKIVGGPSWLEWDHFDINAKLPPDSTPETQKLMLQSLLADRFKLVLHNDSKDLPAYALTAGKSPKLKKSDGTGDPGCRSELAGLGATANPDGGFSINRAAGPVMNVSTCRGMTMEAFAQFLRARVSQNGVSNQVVDQTELKGAWDFEFKISFQGRMLAAEAGDTVTIFDAVDKQLGLKLTATKIPLPVMLVESANEKPTENLPGVAESMAAPHPAEFDVADVKPSDPAATRGITLRVTPGGGVNLKGVPLEILISQAYGMLSDRMVITPGLEELLLKRYDVIAKPPGSTGLAPVPSAAPSATSPDDDEAAWSVMRVLLADRFKLVTHTEERKLTAYKLVAVKPKMKKADPSERTKTMDGPGADGKDPRNATPSRTRLVAFQNVTMAQFADALEGISSYLGTPVVDATDLEGSFDFTLNFSPVGAMRNGGGGPQENGAAQAAEPNGAITLFEAVEEQLGLKLVEEKRMVPVFVIDHVEAKPTDN